MIFSHFCPFIFTQIIGESLPISSSAHVQLLSLVTGTCLPEWYYYILHGPTIAILFIFFRKDWLVPLRYFLGFLHVDNPAKKQALSRVIKRLLYRLYTPLRKFILLGICAELPILLAYSFFKVFLTHDFIFRALPIGLLFTACALYSLKYVSRSTKNTPSYSDALCIGCAQALSLFPGISRLGITYTIARWCGIQPAKAFRFSCTIQLPLIIAGFAKGIYDKSALSHSLSSNTHYLGLYSCFCIVIATCIAYGALYTTWVLIKQEKVWYYAYYFFVPISISLYMLSRLLIS